MALSQEDCDHVLLKLSAPTSKKAELLKTHPHPQLRLSRSEEKDLRAFLETPLSPPKSRPSSTSSTSTLLKQAESKLPPEESRAFSDWLLGQFFEDPLAGFEDHFLGRQRQLFPSGPTRYNHNGERPFDGYLAAREHLKSLPLSSLNLSSIEQLHRILMSRESIREDSGKIFQTDKVPPRNSQGLKDSELAQIRDESVGFSVDGKHFPSGLDGIGHTITEIEKQNLYLKQMRNGTLSYAPLVRWRSIDTKKPLSDPLVRKLLELEKKYGVNGLKNLKEPEIAQAQKEFLTELTERLWNETLLDLEKAETQGDVIKAAARFQRDFLSIHPFLDGNGRLARLLTEKLLESKGLPAPLYTHWGEDVTLSQAQLEGLLARGVQLSQQYQNELAQALSQGQSFETVPNPVLSIRARELLGGGHEIFDEKAFLKWVENHRESLATFPEAVEAYRQSGGSHSPEINLTPEQFQTVFSLLGGQMKNFGLEEFLLWKKDQPALSQSFSAQVDEYATWLGGLSSKDQQKAIRLAPASFQRSFAQLSDSEASYNSKMERFYGNRSIYRGVPTERYLTDLELVRLMAQPSSLTVGNGVPLLENPESRFPVFQNYNQELLRQGKMLSAQATQHSEGTTDQYFSSGMVSFTDQEGIGRNWQFSTTNNVGILFTARERQVGVVHTDINTPQLGLLGLPHERENALIAGVDPETITAIEVKQAAPDPKDHSPRRTKTARRVNFNTVEIREVIFDENDIPKVQESSRWRISPDGAISRLEAKE